jgi:4-hydroxybenzoate polyprenyltransferase
MQGEKQMRDQRSKIRPLADFLEMIKWEHSVFALPFAYLGLFLAENGWPRFQLWAWVTVAMVSFRTMAMAANRVVDAAIDARNPRTKDRALPAGKLRPAGVVAAALISLLVFEWSARSLGSLCFILSPVPVLLAWFYPYAKRFTWSSHWILGIILGIAPYGAWLASRGQWSWIPAFLSAGVAAWVAGFDMIYALQDVDFDRSEGLYSFPARFGQKTTMRMTQVLHGLSVASWMIAGYLAGMGWIYTGGLVLIAFFLIRQQWLIRSFGLQRIEESFFVMNAIVSIAIFVAALADLSLR